MDTNIYNQKDLSLRNRIISTQVKPKSKRNGAAHANPRGATSPRLEFMRINNSLTNINNHQNTQHQLEDIDTDGDEQPFRINDQHVRSRQNSPSSNQFISASPKNSTSALRASLSNQNIHGQHLNEPKGDENIVDMMKTMMQQLTTISSRMDRLEQNQVVQDAKVRDPVVEQIQPSPNKSKSIDVLAGKDSRSKQNYSGKNMYNYSSNDIYDDVDDDNDECWGSDDDSYGSNSSHDNVSLRDKVNKAVVLDSYQIAWNWWVGYGFKLWGDYMNLSENIDDFNFIMQYARISNKKLGGVPFMLPNGTVMMLRTKGKSSLKLSMVLEAICSFMGADPFLQKSGAMLTNDFFPSKIVDFMGFVDELRTIVMYMGKHGLKLFGIRIMHVLDISLINEFLLKIQAKASSVVSSNGKNRVTNYAAFFMIFLKIWNNAFMNEDLRLLVSPDALSYMNNQCNMFIGNGAVHPALSIPKIMLFFGWVCQNCGLLGVCNLFCSNCRAKGDKSKDDKMTLEKAYASQELMIGTNTRDFNAFYSRSGLSV
jgi:hypothetical protein